jgi:mannose-6-phosphate isomerase-like protein (cupin superfamily)
MAWQNGNSAENSTGVRSEISRAFFARGRSAAPSQMHHHRVEHWIVVRGMARATISDETKIEHESESTDSPRATTTPSESSGL